MAAPRRTLLQWLPGLMVALLAVVLLMAWGVSAAELVRYSTYWAVVVALPGAVAWRVLGPRLRYGVEDLAMGVCVGYAAETLARIIASVVGLPTRLGDVAPLALALLVLGVPRLRKRVARPWHPLPREVAWSYAALLGLVFVWFAFGFFARQPLSWSDSGGPENDLLFALALAGEATHRWPLEFPWVAGEPLLYHWFFAEHLASARELSGVQLPTLVLRLELLPAAALVVLTTGAIATRLAKRRWAGPLAAAILFVVQDASPIPWTQLVAQPAADLTGAPYNVSFWWSTSGAFAAVIFAPLATIVVDVVRHHARRRAWALLLPLLLVGMGAKASIVPVVLVGTAWVVLTSWWFTRRTHRPALAVVLAAGIVFLVAWWAVYGARAQGLEIHPMRHVVSTSLGAAILGDGVPGRTPVLAMVALVLCLGAALAPVAGLVLLLRRGTGTDPAAQLCVGVLLLGAAGMVLLYHQGQSNLYFLRTGMPLLAAGSAWGVCSRVPAGLARRFVRPAACSFAVGVTGMGLVATRDWTAFAPSQQAPGRLGQVAVAWAILGILGAVAVVGQRQGRAGRFAVGVLVVAFVAGCGAVRVPGQAVAWVAGHPVGWVDVSANPSQRIDANAVRAAQWIRDNSDVDDLVVTNVLCSNGSTRTVDVCDNRTFWVSAYSERRTIVSGWGYTAKANGLASQTGLVNSWQLPFWDQPRLDRVRDFLGQPTEGGAQRLADDGARWVLAVPGHDEVNPQMPYVAEASFRAGDVVVYRLPILAGTSVAAQLPSS